MRWWDEKTTDKKSLGFNTLMLNGQLLYGTQVKYKYSPHSLEMFDLINEEPDKYNINKLTVSEELDYTLETIPSGTYKVITYNHDYYLEPHIPNNKEAIIEFDLIHEVGKEIDVFINSKEIYNKLHLIYKRGILLYGPPGTGKTTFIRKLIINEKYKDAIIIFIDKYLPNQILKRLQNDSRLKIIVFEELVTTIDKENINNILNFLDGPGSLSNMIVIATTNNPELLPLNIVDRPGRFDKLYKIDYLTNKDIQLYADFFLQRKLTEEELEELDQVTISSLKETFLLMLRDDKSLIDVIKRIHRQSELVKQEFKETKGAGFLSSSIWDDD